MPIPFKTVQIPFLAGMDESFEPLALPAPRLTTMLNCRFNLTGGVSKRLGWANTSNVPIGAPQGVKVFGSNDNVYCTVPFSINITGGTGQIRPFRLCIQHGHGANQCLPLGDASLCECICLGRDAIFRGINTSGTTYNNPQTVPDWGIEPVSGHIVMTWCATRDGYRRIYAQVIDAVTRAVIVQTKEISGGANVGWSGIIGDTGTPEAKSCVNPKVVRQGVVLYVIYQDYEDGTINGISYTPSTASWGLDTVIIAAPNANGNFDVVDGTTFWSMIYRDAATPSIKLAQFNGLAQTLSAAIAEAPGCVSIAVADSTHYYITWSRKVVNPERLRFAVIDTSLTTTHGPFDIDTAAPANTFVVQLSVLDVDGGTHAIVVWTISGDNTNQVYGPPFSSFVRVTSATGAVGSSKKSRQSIELISRPFLAASGTIYCNYVYNASTDGKALTPASRPSDGFNTAFTIALTDVTSLIAGGTSPRYLYRTVASWAIGQAGKGRRYGTGDGASTPDTSISFLQNTLSRFEIAATGELDFMLMTNQIVESTVAPGFNTQGRFGADICRLGVNDDNFFQQYHTELGGCTIFSGALPMICDGQNIFEYGFLTPPEGGSMAAAAFGHPALAAGAYAVSLIWEYKLATGDVMQSAPAVVHRVDTGASTETTNLNDWIAVNLPPLMLTAKFENWSPGTGQPVNHGLPVVAKVYRSETNGSILYFEGDNESSTFVTKPCLGGYIPNTPLDVAVMGTTPLCQLTNPDSTIITHEIIYTTDGILANYPLPALSHIHTHRNRIFGVQAEDPHYIVFTHIYEPGEMPGWHPFLTFRVEGKANALASLDDKLVIFTDRGVFIVTGDGPDRKGLNSNFTTPQLFYAEYSCVAPGSILNLPAGLAWQSEAGILLLSRSLNITRIGGPVEQILESVTTPYISSACIVKDKEYAYWLLWDNPNLMLVTSTIILVYDYRHNQWGYDLVQYNDGENPPSVAIIQSIDYINGEAYMTLATANVIWGHEGYSDPAATNKHQYITQVAVTAWINLAAMQQYQRFRWVNVIGNTHGGHDLEITVTTDGPGGPSQVFNWTDAQLTTFNQYEFSMHIKNQRSDQIQIQLVDGESTLTPAATQGPTWIGLAIDIGFKKDLVKLPQARLH
jgi:hypothetical protein